MVSEKIVNIQTSMWENRIKEYLVKEKLGKEKKRTKKYKHAKQETN